MLHFARPIGATALILLLTACGGGGSTISTIPASGLSAGYSTTTSAARSVYASAIGGHVKRVLLISIDGMHAGDLQRFVATHPTSALAELSQSGATYTNAHAPVPTDSFPGLLALTTGGHPASTGVYYEVNYDRTGYPPGSNCSGAPGTVVAFDESIDYNPDDINAGGGINPANLTEALVNGVCRPVYPHDYLRVNTIFEVVKANGGRTAWSDKEHSYDILNGPSGNGVDDLYDLEIAAGGTTGSIPATEKYDDLKVSAILNEIDGKTSTGTAGVGTPALFGMNFQAVSVGQKVAHFDFGTGPRGGYTDASGMPTPQLEGAIEHTDASIGMILGELAKQGLASSTLVVISAKHGQAPIDYSLRRGIGGAGGAFKTQLASNSVGFVQTDDLALIWLTDRSRQNVADAYAKLSDPTFETALGYENGRLFSSTMTPPGYGAASDPRSPDFSVAVDLGVIYTGGSKIAEHGGFSDDDTHVALLVSQPGEKARTIDNQVQTAQVAPTILKALGIAPGRLKAVQQEGTAPLPGLGN